MIDYQKLKEKVSVRDYAESIGYETSGNGMIRCPFHNDRTRSPCSYSSRITPANTA